MHLQKAAKATLVAPHFGMQCCILLPNQLLEQASLQWLEDLIIFTYPFIIY